MVRIRGKGPAGWHGILASLRSWYRWYYGAVNNMDSPPFSMHNIQLGFHKRIRQVLFGRSINCLVTWRCITLCQCIVSPCIVAWHCLVSCLYRGIVSQHIVVLYCVVSMHSIIALYCLVLWYCIALYRGLLILFAHHLGPNLIVRFERMIESNS